MFTKLVIQQSALRVQLFKTKDVNFKHVLSELQIREGIKNNSKIIFLISRQKHVL